MAEIDASPIQQGLQKTADYLDNLVTEEYSFQRDSLYAPQIPPQLIAASLLVAALAGYMSLTHRKALRQMPAIWQFTHPYFYFPC